MLDTQLNDTLQIGRIAIFPNSNRSFGEKKPRESKSRVKDSASFLLVLIHFGLRTIRFAVKTITIERCSQSDSDEVSGLSGSYSARCFTESANVLRTVRLSGDCSTLRR